MLNNSTNEQKRLLLMEDSDIFADMVSGFLKCGNYTIERAVNGFEGIKKVYEFLPHIIISDIEMPLLKGYQAIRLLKSRKNTKDIPVIILTTLDETKDKFWVKQAGADCYLEKTPENLPILAEKIKSVLSSSQNIDFTAIEKERKKINDNSIIEIVSNLLDNKLFQTTVIGTLAELSGKVNSMEDVAQGIFELLETVCEAEITALLIRGSGRTIYEFYSNNAGFTKETEEYFKGICASDFNNLFPDFKPLSGEVKQFNAHGTCEKKILSYIRLPLTSAGSNFASLHIANSKSDYFTPSIMENINVFSGASSPIIANALSMHELSLLQKNTRSAFARYVPAEVMDELINETNKKTFTSENKNVAVLFCDIRSFTAISEKYNAQAVVDFLNAFFSKMGGAIISESGHIDKFIGDAIMAVFGAVHNLENPAKNSIAAALKMLSALEGINKSGNGLINEKINAGIGINYGESIMGNIGFQNKIDYTIIGDAVNLASRIENLTKNYRHPLIVSEYVYELTKDFYLMRKIDYVRVKGKDKPAGIYAVYSGYCGEENKNETPEIPSLLINKDALDNYNKGLKVYYMNEWKLAREYFIKALNADENDFISKLYLERANKYIDNPPKEGCGEVITIDEK